jgi:hypothetical protein
MAMLRTLRGRNVHARVHPRSFSIRPRIRPERRVVVSGLFFVLCPGLIGVGPPPGKRVRKVLCG